MTDNIFDNNFSKLKAYNDSLANAIYTFSLNTEYEINLDQGKEIGLLIDGRQLCSHHDRMGYAFEKIKKLDLNKKVTIFGFALGDEIRAIEQKSPNTDIEVVLLNPALFYNLLSIDDEISYFFKPNIRFTIPDDGMKVNQNSVINFQELYLDPKTFNSLKMRLINYLDNDFAIRVQKKRFDVIKTNALRKNYDQLKKETLLSSDDLNNISKTILLAAAGPSLEDNIETLIKLKNEGNCLIAVDAALACLEKHHIVPDYIISCDLNVYSSLKNVIFKDFESYKKSTLIFSATTEAELFTKFPGKRRYIFREEDLGILDYQDKHKADFLVFYGSVLNEAVALSLKTNPECIKLFGVDLAFKGEQTHSCIRTGVAIRVSEVKVKVLCNDGRIQNTERNFCLYREELEKAIERNPNVRFENYSKTGAVIHGAHVVD